MKNSNIMFTKRFEKIISSYNTIVHKIYYAKTHLLYPHWCNTLEDSNF